MITGLRPTGGGHTLGVEIRCTESRSAETKTYVRGYKWTELVELVQITESSNSKTARIIRDRRGYIAEVFLRRKGS